MQPSVETIADRLLREAQETAQAELSRARRVAEREAQAAEAAARDMQARADASMAQEERDQFAKLGARAELEAQRMRLASQADLLRLAIADALRGLAEMPRDSAYLELLESATIGGISALPPEPVELALSRRDADFLRSEDRWRWQQFVAALRTALGREVDVSISPDCVESTGGLIVKLSGGRLIFRNTFEDVVQRNEDELRLHFRRMLFEDK